MNFSISVPADFSLKSTITSHGWYALPPFEADESRSTLRFAYRRKSTKPRIVTISQPSQGTLLLTQKDFMSPTMRMELSSTVRSILRLDEDYTEFYTTAKRIPRYRWIGPIGAGRLLRAPTVFEDVLKMLCTTNCSWALTEIIVGNLCRHFGSEISEGKYAFPLPEAIADSSEKFLRKHVRAGYRAPYILELSKNIVKNRVAPEEWRRSQLPTPELYEEVRSVKGIGPYAAGNILKLLGRYDYLGIDSWCRKKFFDLYGSGRRRTDRTIEKHYEEFGKWRGLLFWLDVTKEWYAADGNVIL